MASLNGAETQRIQHEAPPVSERPVSSFAETLKRAEPAEVMTAAEHVIARLEDRARQEIDQVKTLVSGVEGIQPPATIQDRIAQRGVQATSELRQALGETLVTGNAPEAAPMTEAVPLSLQETMPVVSVDAPTQVVESAPQSGVRIAPETTRNETFAALSPDVETLRRALEKPLSDMSDAEKQTVRELAQTIKERLASNEDMAQSGLRVQVNNLNKLIKSGPSESFDEKDIVAGLDTWLSTLPQTVRTGEAPPVQMEEEPPTLEAVTQPQQVPEKSPAVIAAELLRRPVKIIKPEAVQVSKIVSVGEVSPKLAKRMTPDELAAVSPVLEQQATVASEQYDEAPEITVGEATLTAEEQEAVDAEAVKTTAVEAVAEAQQEVSEQEAMMMRFNEKGDSMFQKGDREGLQHTIEASAANLQEQLAALEAYKKAGGSTLRKDVLKREARIGMMEKELEIAKLRHERMQRQLDILEIRKRKDASTDDQEKAQLEQQAAGQESELAAIDGKISGLTDDIERIGKNYAFSASEEDTAVKEKSADTEKHITTGIKEKIQRVGEKMIDKMVGLVDKWLEFSMTAKSTVLEDISHWLDSSEKEYERKRTEREAEEKRTAEQGLAMQKERAKMDDAERLQAERAELIKKRQQEDAEYAARMSAAKNKKTDASAQQNAAQKAA